MQCWQATLVPPRALRVWSWLISRVLRFLSRLFLSWTFSYPHKEFLILYPPCTCNKYNPLPPHASLTRTHPAPAHRAVQVPTPTLQMQVPATRAGWPTRVKPVRVLPATCTGKPVRVKISCAVEEAYNSSTLANPRNYSLITEADVTQQMQVHSCSAIWMWGVWGFVG